MPETLTVSADAAELTYRITADTRGTPRAVRP